ncbi:winged helix-turn-helix transcriptional regulator (plasmid) [Agrobacterium tumefaciens]|uniref:Winged helix-turn-helix transcriptional regulator n=1 Tax=Agrobacterium tumefaciens TaxID=358 RepID=A0AAE6EHJ0_AGRTU|nr:MarR family winged helix-turn-helix transcriptional regulator [Agrobacterium tumefaciens]QCL77042.1 winged helix-turn-helix transcriptional regulator [Agrobacterium tumefaciens]QCL82549.1 winged helix-turn-helix transcriptional regulator [Agrobacterium tumefaciens]CUX71074.1 MarR family transcriptional regulator [Agrobacterium sp. NCPPB 925]
MIKSVKINECTNLVLRKLTRAVSRHYDRYLSSAQLKITQYTLLSHVAVLGPVGLGKLARVMEMDASTLTRNMRPLLDQKLISLCPGLDARSRSVEMTGEGRARWTTARLAWREAQNSLHEKLSPERVCELHEILGHSLKAMNKDHGSPRGICDAE